MPAKPMPDVIVLLPGILGSVLAKDGREVWAISGGAIARLVRSLGSSVHDLILPEDIGRNSPEDGVTATRLLPDTHMIPGLWKVDGYSKIAAAIKKWFDVTPGLNYFEFPYDWRLDNRIAARRLQAQTRQWLEAWRKAPSGNPNAKLILIAHSMGGIISRYFLEVLEGWRDTKMLLTFGTPYRGSLNALNFVANGYTKNLGPFEVLNMSNFLRSFPSVYQLLPIYPCYDAGDGQLVRLSEAEAPNVKREMVREAFAFQDEIREAVDAHLEDEEYLRNRYRIYPVVGTFQPTLQSGRLAGEKVTMLQAYDGEDMDGDGTVPRVSATPIEVEAHAAMFASEQHASLQNDDAVLVQLQGLLSGLRIDTSIFRHGIARLSVDVDDAYSAQEPVTVRARPEDESLVLTARIENVETGESVMMPLTRDADDWRRGEFAPLPVGTYRVTVKDVQGSGSVTDVFVVTD